MRVVDCSYCGEPTTYTGTKMCPNCWEVDSRIAQFLKSPKARIKVKALINSIEGDEDNK